MIVIMMMVMIMMVWTLASAGSSAQMKTMATLPCAQSALWWWWWSLGWWQFYIWNQCLYSNDSDDHGKCGDALMKTACRNSRGLNGASVCDATASYCSAKGVSAWDCSVTQCISTRAWCWCCASVQPQRRTWKWLLRWSECLSWRVWQLTNLSSKTLFILASQF